MYTHTHSSEKIVIFASFFALPSVNGGAFAFTASART
jgi:hypothetical protein